MEPPTRHKGVLKVSAQFLVEALGLPKGTIISNCAQLDEDFYAGRSQYSFLVEHPDLPETPLGCKLPTVNAQFHRAAPSTEAMDRLVGECLDGKTVTYPAVFDKWTIEPTMDEILRVV